MATPAETMAAGASHRVVGKPITGASDPAKATAVILEEMAGTVPPDNGCKKSPPRRSSKSRTVFRDYSYFPAYNLQEGEVRPMHRFALLIATMALLAGAQAQNNDLANRSDQNNEAKGITVPAGTTVLLHLRSPINTKNARVGDAVYCETAFPVTQDNVMVIPSHTYVKGQIMRLQRPGRVKGRAELQLHFNTLIFPDGYTVQLPGSLQNTPGSENHHMEGEEGTVKANGQKGKDAGTIATTAGTGAAVGAVVDRSVSGAAIGGGVGGAVGLAKVLLTRGQDIRLETGTAVEMVLERPLTLDPAHAGSRGRNSE